MNLTPASSSDLPSAAILTRVSESGTRLMQTAILIRGDATTPRCTLQVVNHHSARGKQTCGFSSGNRRTTQRRGVVQRLEVGAKTHLHMSRRAGCEPTLPGRSRRRGILRERAEAVVTPVEQVPRGAAQLQLAPGERERQIGDGVVGQARGGVVFVAAQPLVSHVASVRSEEHTSELQSQSNLV